MIDCFVVGGGGGGFFLNLTSVIGDFLNCDSKFVAAKLYCHHMKWASDNLLDDAFYSILF